MPTSGSNSSRTIEIEGRPPRSRQTCLQSTFGPRHRSIFRPCGFRCCADADSPPPIARIPRRWWSSRIRWRGSSGRMRTRLDDVSGSETGRGCRCRRLRRRYSRLVQPAKFAVDVPAVPPGAEQLLRPRDSHRRGPTSVAPGARRCAAGRRSDQPVFEVMTMRRALHERTIGLQYMSAIMTVFAAIALCSRLSALRFDHLSRRAASPRDRRSYGAWRVRRRRAAADRRASGPAYRFRRRIGLVLSSRSAG